MSSPPNEVYTVFSFIGFVLCAIPLYWHLKARNTGTCLYMIWTGLGCLLQCINSIVWNKNMINRVPVYCDISTHAQIALNVAVPASSLCINRQLYNAARVNTAGATDAKKRRNLIYDLLIGVGIPILQMITEYVVSGNRYDVFEDFGPVFSIWLTPLAFVLFYAWPVVIGVISFFYCVMAIYAFYKRRRIHMQSVSNANRNQYLRMMTISSIEILGTIPVGMYYIVSNAKTGVVPWKGWTRVHSHYSEVVQIAGFTWKNDPMMSVNLELFRWSLVGCAFVFFALFGFSGEAREHYSRIYKSLVSGIGKSTSAPRGALPAIQNPKPIVVQMSRNKDNLSISLTDQSSILSIYMENTLNQDPILTLQDSDSDSEVVSFYTAKSFDDPDMEHQYQLPRPPGLPRAVRPVSVMTVPSTPSPVFLPTVRPISVPPALPLGTLPTLHPVLLSVLPHFSDLTETIMPMHVSSSVETVQRM